MAKRDVKLLEDNITNSPTEIGYEDVTELEEGFQQLILTDPKYSLLVDPENKYGFTEQEKDFIQQMVQYRNVQFVSTVLMKMSLEEGVDMYKSWKVQQEIKRINMAMYARRFATKMADLDEIGGFLTSGLRDENIPISERWDPKDKLTASKLLVNINILKRKALARPQEVEVIEVQKDLDKLSPNELKQLIEFNDEENVEKEKLIDIINEDNLLTMEEIKNLRMMTIEELQDLVATITQGENDNEED